MRTNLYLTCLTFLILITGISCNSSTTLTVDELRCENLINPNAIDNTTPHFSWKVSSENGKDQQYYYEIQVATDSIKLLSGEVDLWQTKKIKSSESVMVPYMGAALESRSLAYWRVRVWDKKGRKSSWSDIARFGIGILFNKEFQGNYIGLPADAGNTHTPLLREKLILKEKSTSFLHVNSLGYHEVYINGVRVGDDVLSPAVSQLNKRTITVTYDVTSYLKEGENDLVLWLGTGWYKKTGFHATHDGALVKAQLDILGGDNNWETIAITDTSWLASETGYRDTGTWQALRFGGERMDARLIPDNLETESLDKLEWYSAVEVNVPELAVSPEMTEANKIQETFSPINIQQLENGKWLIDMGKNLNGWFEMSFENMTRGDSVIIEYTDYMPEGVFHDMGQVDIYVAAGKPKETFRNKFNHHAFRYVRVSNVPKEPRTKDIKAYLIHSDYRATSTFECSDADLNAIHDMVQYTMRCLTFSGYMVDCPHLERAGYGGDGNSSTMTLQTMYNVSPLFTNWMIAWDDALREDGGLPHVAPNPWAGGGGPYWCGFIVMAPWRTYLNYNDDRLIKRFYHSMKKWMGYVDAHTVDGLLKRWPDTSYRDWYLGDWLAPMGVDAGNQASVDLVNNCFISECLLALEKIANILGERNEADAFKNQRLSLNTLIHDTFFDPETNTYATGSQFDMTYPMLMGITPAEVYDDVKEQLFINTEQNNNNHIGVGLFGVPILTDWTIQNKAVDYMYTMLKKRDYPGFLYMIDNDATTTWEYWNGERSRIHNCYNGIGLWFYQALAGIQPDEENPGYKHVFIEPQIPNGVEWTKATIDTPYGTVEVYWQLEGEDKLALEVGLPAGTTATIKFPEGILSGTINGQAKNPKNAYILSSNGKIKRIYN